MIRFEDVYQNARKAFLNKELYEFISGGKGYDCPVLDAPTCIPTDWTVIIPNGIFALYKEETIYGEEIKKDFFDAIRKLICGSDVEIWEAAHVLFFLLRSQAIGTAPFNVEEDILTLFCGRIDERKAFLAKNYQYDGKDFPNGLLGDIERLNGILIKKYSTEMVK